MTQQKMMGRTIFSSFVLAVAVILVAAFLAPRTGLSSSVGCNTAYGIDKCSAESAVR